MDDSDSTFTAVSTRGLFEASDLCDDRRIGLFGGVFFFVSVVFDATVESVCSVVSSIGGFSRGGGGGLSTISCFRALFIFKVQLGSSSRLKSEQFPLLSEPYIASFVTFPP